MKLASIIPKAAIEREKRDACISISEREQARRSQSRQRKAIVKEEDDSQLSKRHCRSDEYLADELMQ